MTHKSEDYKISAVKYYLKNKDNIRKTCKIFDVNGATNIYKIAYNAINNKERPNYLSRINRSCNLSGSLDELPKPKFTRFVKGKPC